MYYQTQEDSNANVIYGGGYLGRHVEFKYMAARLSSHTPSLVFVDLNFM